VILTASALSNYHLSNREKLRQYGRSVGLDEIEALLDKYWPIYEGAISPQGNF